ncbi:MAG TPA: hypothetical protein VK815_14860 [Candidatus Acidoferrales bacterium]|jgi:hypothetical protein|nr:hypothetical protein [Candidatus Acidoferrales bacterium]
MMRTLIISRAGWGKLALPAYGHHHVGGGELGQLALRRGKPNNHPFTSIPIHSQLFWIFLFQQACNTQASRLRSKPGVAVLASPAHVRSSIFGDIRSNSPIFAPFEKKNVVLAYGYEPDWQPSEDEEDSLDPGWLASC